MGKVVLSGEGAVTEDMEMEELVDDELLMKNDVNYNDDKKKKDGSFVMWKSLLPRSYLRVLLVESDDSTRQIIAALLKNCGYRVLAVSDGVKAWELLKEKPSYFDIILTEVQLPSISGFCLLNMIMGHEICRNIPVIMMSSQDSISIVFKCMLGGAADFLVKPIRRNELRNLWQHVWRRQTSGGLRHGCCDGNPVLEKMAAISENNAASNQSSAYVACVQKSNNYSEKGSDAQSSCTKPDMEAESACLSNMQGVLEPKFSTSFAIDGTLENSEEHHKLGGNQFMAAVSYKDYGLKNYTVDLDKEVRVEPSKEAFDLIGTIDNRKSCSYRNRDDSFAIGDDSSGPKSLSDKNDKRCKFSSTLLELSLGRSEPSGGEEIEERHTLNHSNASAFSWYNTRTGQHALATPARITETQQLMNRDGKDTLNQGADNCFNIHQSRRVVKNIEKEDSTLEADPASQDKMVFSCPLGVIPLPVPFSGVPLDGLHTGYGTLLQPMFYAHPTAPPGPPPWNIDSSNMPDTLPVNSSDQPTLHSNNNERDQSHDQNTDKCVVQSGTKQENLEPFEIKNYSPSVPEQSGSSKFCKRTQSQIKSTGCGSICDGSSKDVHANGFVAVVTSENGNNESIFTSDQIKVIDCDRVSHREIALNKFRMKRKDRCFEKKVRYRSRQKLAEQRPRVKGQFVRRAQPDSQPNLN